LYAALAARDQAARLTMLEVLSEVRGYSGVIAVKGIQALT
jgi:hypothetical protein